MLLRKAGITTVSETELRHSSERAGKCKVGTHPRGEQPKDKTVENSFRLARNDSNVCTLERPVFVSYKQLVSCLYTNFYPKYSAFFHRQVLFLLADTSLYMPIYTLA